MNLGAKVVVAHEIHVTTEKRLIPGVKGHVAEEGKVSAAVDDDGIVVDFGNHGIWLVPRISLRLDDK